MRNRTKEANYGWHKITIKIKNKYNAYKKVKNKVTEKLEIGLRHF